MRVRVVLFNLVTSDRRVS